MIESFAVVTRIDGALAYVAPERTGCGRCHEPGGCGSQVLGEALCSRPREFCVDNVLGARVGERVTIGVPEGGVLKAALRAYLFPLVLALGAAVGTRLLLPAAGEGGAALAGLCGLVVAFIYNRLRTPPAVCPVMLARDASAA